MAFRNILQPRPPLSKMTTIKVVVRVRPLLSSEIADKCEVVLDVLGTKRQIIVKKDKSFNFNHVFLDSVKQAELYLGCVPPMIENVLKGFNVTVLSYGQKGSGKTYTMGTTYDSTEDMGIIPRALKDIFQSIRDNHSAACITISLLEIFQEEIYDLLSGEKNPILLIQEDRVEGFKLPGLTEVPVTSAKEVLDAVKKGSLNTSAATNASRGHIIFSVNILQGNKKSRIQFVDLAGKSHERAALKTNKGLFVLGKVISSLSDEEAKQDSIAYENSNLTMLLKDAFGGNSMTLMIACVSPTEYDIEDTLATLHCAEQAGNITNKPRINQEIMIPGMNITQLFPTPRVSSQTADVEGLTKEIAILKLNNSRLLSQVSLAQKELAENKSEVIKLRTDKEALLWQAKQSQERVQELETQLDEQNQTKNEELQAEIASLRSEKDLLLWQAQQSQTQVKELESRMSNLSRQSQTSSFNRLPLPSPSPSCFLEELDLTSSTRRTPMFSPITDLVPRAYSTPVSVTRSVAMGRGCGCQRTDCTSMRCGCRKAGQSCGASCRCLMCRN